MRLRLSSYSLVPISSPLIIVTTLKCNRQYNAITPVRLASFPLFYVPVIGRQHHLQHFRPFPPMASRSPLGPIKMKRSLMSFVGFALPYKRILPAMHTIQLIITPHPHSHLSATFLIHAIRSSPIESRRSNSSIAPFRLTNLLSWHAL